MSNYPYDSVVNAEEVGMDRGKLKRVADRFLTQQKNGRFPGGQLVVRRKGKVVLNLACGEARGWQGRGGEPMPVTPNTPFPVYSTGKPMVAIIIAMLEFQGKLDINAPIVTILPEFAGMGRDEITALDVLTHRAGIILTDLINNHALWADPDAVWQHLIKTPPRFPRGTFAYMPGEYGIILDRLAKQVTGKAIAELFHSELVAPLCLGNMSYGLGSHQIDELAWSYWQGKARYIIADMNVAEGFEQKNNAPEAFAAGNPAFSMVTDAANLAAFYEFLLNGGRTADGKQLIDESLLRSYTTKQTSGWNKSVKTYLSLGRGFMLGTVAPSLYGWWGTSGCFGHAGIFSSLAYADRETGLSVAIVTNGNRSMGDFFKRIIPLTHELRQAC